MTAFPTGRITGGARVLDTVIDTLHVYVLHTHRGPGNRLWVQILALPLTTLYDSRQATYPLLASTLLSVKYKLQPVFKVVVSNK